MNRKRETWYEDWFNRIYLKVYAHRDIDLAETEVDFLVGVLDLRKDDPILDLCCGAGRHLRRLRELGFRRTFGLDLSEDLLEVAARESMGLDGLARGDMRRLPFGSSFRAVLSLFTSFGYFEEEEENQATLREIHRALLPGGRVLLDLPSYGLADRLVPETQREIDGITIVEKRRYDTNRKRIEKEILIESKEGTETFYESVRVYFYGEIMKMFAEADLAVEGLYGNFQGAEFNPRDERMIVVGQRTSAPAHLMR